MEKLDLTKERKELFAGKSEAAFLDTGENLYLAVDGTGAPAGGDFAKAVGALYGVAYALKSAFKQKGRDFKVCPFEGMWGRDLDFADKSKWAWTLQMLVPDFVTAADVEAARAKAGQKKDAEAAGRIRLEKYSDGFCAQILHTGPYATEHETIARMMKFAESNGYRRARGYHREVYLSDPNRSAPEKMKTLIRQPVEKA